MKYYLLQTGLHSSSPQHINRLLWESWMFVWYGSGVGGGWLEARDGRRGVEITTTNIFNSFILVEYVSTHSLIFSHLNTIAIEAYTKN